MNAVDLESHTAELASLISAYGIEHEIPPITMLGLLDLASTQLSLAMLAAEEKRTNWTVVHVYTHPY